jgi:hypothetical protein
MRRAVRKCDIDATYHHRAVYPLLRLVPIHSCFQSTFPIHIARIALGQMGTGTGFCAVAQRADKRRESAVRARVTIITSA